MRIILVPPLLSNRCLYLNCFRVGLVVGMLMVVVVVVVSNTLFFKEFSAKLNVLFTSNERPPSSSSFCCHRLVLFMEFFVFLKKSLKSKQYLFQGVQPKMFPQKLGIHNNNNNLSGRKENLDFVRSIALLGLVSGKFPSPPLR